MDLLPMDPVEALVLTSEKEYLSLTMTAKIKLDVPDDAVDLLKQTMRCYVDCCNRVSDYIFTTRCISKRKIHDALYYELRGELGITAQQCESVFRDVVGKYRSMRTNQLAKKERQDERIAKQKAVIAKCKAEGRKPPRFKKEKPVDTWIHVQFKKSTVKLVYKRDYSVRDGKITIKTGEKRINVGYCATGREELFSNRGGFGSADLTFKHGKWYIHIPVTFPKAEITLDRVKHIVGVDRGIRFLATTYDSNGNTSFFSGNVVKAKRAHYKAKRAELQAIQTPSSRRKLKKMGNKENRWVTDVNHCVSKALLSECPRESLIVLEDLSDIREATERVRTKNRYISVSWPYYQLEQFLTYKAKEKNCVVVKVDPRYTSQRCPICGHREASNRKSDKHLFRCRSCGYQSNDDRIGAMNLYCKGIACLLADRTVPDTP